MCAPCLASQSAQVRWITFHSGYDFGYLLKLLTCSSLPANETEFFQLLKARRLEGLGAGGDGLLASPGLDWIVCLPSLCAVLWCGVA